MAKNAIQRLFVAAILVCSPHVRAQAQDPQNQNSTDAQQGFVLPGTEPAPTDTKQEPASPAPNSQNQTPADTKPAFVLPACDPGTVGITLQPIQGSPDNSYMRRCIGKDDKGNYVTLRNANIGPIGELSGYTINGAKIEGLQFMTGVTFAPATNDGDEKDPSIPVVRNDGVPIPTPPTTIMTMGETGAETTTWQPDQEDRIVTCPSDASFFMSPVSGPEEWRVPCYSKDADGVFHHMYTLAISYEGKVDISNSRVVGARMTLHGKGNTEVKNLRDGELRFYRAGGPQTRKLPGYEPGN